MTAAAEWPLTTLDRDTGRWSYQRLRWEMEVYRARTEELAQVWQAIARGEPPDRDHDGSTWHCSTRYCCWSRRCWEGGRPLPPDLEAGEGTLDGVPG